MRFIDRVKIRIESGAGGNGCVSFRREKHVPRGGPDGGDGGRGGDIIIQTDTSLSTLIDYRYKREYKASAGRPGEGSKMSGRVADPVILKVPPGTVIFDAQSSEILADLTEGEVTVATGGGGGNGNARFATASRQAPRIAGEGRAGEEKELILELKLIADAGIVGLPNSGKSTLISRISAARPKIADYPFTTLVPNLGVVRMGEFSSFVVADVPGLVEGAHKGTGLGHQFLRHVERTSVLLHLVGLAPTDEDPVEAYRTVRDELKAYAQGLAQKESIVALNKSDLVSDEERTSILKKFRDELGFEPYIISAATGEGLNEVVGKLYEMVKAIKD
jgi:GTP-binding protein